MNTEQTVVAILSPVPERRESLRHLFHRTEFACTLMEVDHCCTETADPAIRRLAESHPQIVLIDMEDHNQGLQALKVLHRALPGAWFLVSASTDNSNLIIEAMRAGAREFLPGPVSLANLSQALTRYFGERELPAKSKPKGKIYCITAAKGGAGTTSVTVNLAVSLATSKSVKVALLDLGFPFGDAAEYLNLKFKFGVPEVLASADRLDSVLLESYMSRVHGIAVLPGGLEAQPPPPANTLQKVLHVASETYSHTFIDTHFTCNQEQMYVLAEASAAVLVVLTPELPALWRTDGLIRFLEKIGAGDKVKLVINRASKRYEIAAREIEKTLQHSIYWKLPNNYPAAIQAVNSGKPLVSLNHSSLASSYGQLAQALTGIPLQKQQRGLFGIFR